MSAQQFDGKVALVTGGASGIGEACVLTFARGGAKVMIADLNEDRGAHTVAAVKDAGSDALFVRVDVANPRWRVIPTRSSSISPASTRSAAWASRRTSPIWSPSCARGRHRLSPARTI